jgi:ABC-2 type transport system permease protein
MQLMRIFTANVKMIYRDKIALFWAMAFPLLFVVVFGLFMSGTGNTLGKLSFIDNANDQFSAQIRQALVDSGLFQVQDESWDRDQAMGALRDSKTVFVIAVPGFDEPTQPQGTPSLSVLYDLGNQGVNGAALSFLHSLQTSQAQPVFQINESTTTANKVTGFDIVFIGLLCMAVMNYSITGFAINMSSYREQKILKRLLTTPLPIWRFMTAEIMAFIVLAVAQIGVMLFFGIVVFGAHVYGSWLFLILLSLFGAVVFLAIGFLVASLSKTSQAASGMATSISIVMMFLSGVFFSITALPGPVYEVVRFLPLSPMIQAMRAVELDSQPVGDQFWRLMLMLAWLLVIAVVSTRLFKFGDE